ncbi:putative F-box domain, galactose oxidase/kelch, beta-propeller, F-box associated interaction [Helianthus debilis subsp. tardiflorus]
MVSGSLCKRSRGHGVRQLHDDVVRNILVHLPAKYLLRFRCVSTHWNCMLKEPSFMKFRSRKNFILPVYDALHLIDDKMPTDDTTNFIVKRCYPIKGNLVENVGVVGTFNGIVLFRYLGALVLYNPFTGAYKKLPSAPTSSCARAAYGFGYGANSDDLKIVRFNKHFKVCDVYNLKEGSWSSWSTSKYYASIPIENLDGTFANGFLYWIASRSRNAFIVLDVKDMVLSEMHPPFVIAYPLGTVNGSLCTLHKQYENRIDMWVMKEQNQWSKIYSFNLPLSGALMNCYPIYILDSGRILMGSYASSNLIVYDPLLDSFKISRMFNRRTMRVLEYVESLVSPSDISSSRLE